jgi:hypothetical protein
MEKTENSSGLQAQPLDTGSLRRRSVGILEFQDSQGRRKTVQLDELSDADRALAEQFGYKPVRQLSSSLMHEENLTMR